MTLKRIILLLFIFLKFNILANSQDLCKDLRIFDGSETILKFGMDTTQNWWFISEPVTGRYRLNINGKESNIYTSINDIKFSPDGKRWAVFVNDNESISILTNDTIIKFNSGTPGEIVFSGNSQNFIYSYKKTDIELIYSNKDTFEILNRFGSLYTDYYGNKIACLGKRGNSVVLNINGVESEYFDAIKPIGFWTNGSFLYAAKSGNGWEIYKDNKSISQIYKDIAEYKINIEGTVAAVIVKNMTNKYQAILIADEYYEPLEGKNYDNIYNLALHPKTALYAYNALQGINTYVVFNSAEYGGAKELGRPFFSSNGDEMYFIGCDYDCFLSINGKRYEVMNTIDLTKEIALAPGTETIAYSTNASLVVKSLTNKNLNAGMMVDYITPPRYNWRVNKYEAMGMINNKLYLLTCRPK